MGRILACKKNKKNYPNCKTDKQREVSLAFWCTEEHRNDAHKNRPIRTCKTHQWLECRTSRTDAGGHHGGVLRASSSSDLFGDFCPWHHSKWNLLDACHHLLLLLLAEMQWWKSTLRKDLCLHNYGIQLSCLVWWCQALSYHHWSHTEMKICSANNFKQIKCYFSSYLGSVQVQSNNVCLFPVQTDDAECLPAAPQSLGMAAACTYHALIHCCSSDGSHL